MLSQRGRVNMTRRQQHTHAACAARAWHPRRNVFSVCHLFEAKAEICIASPRWTEKSIAIRFLRSRRLRRLFVKRLPILKAAFKELRPIRHFRQRIALFRQQAPQSRMMPAELMPIAVAMRTDALPQLFDLFDELLARHLLQVTVHVRFLPLLPSEFSRPLFNGRSAVSFIAGLRSSMDLPILMRHSANQVATDRQSGCSSDATTHLPWLICLRCLCLMSEERFHLPRRSSRWKSCQFPY